MFSIIEAPEAGWGSARTLGGIGGGLAVLAVFAGWELRARHPMLDPRYFRSRRLSAGSLSIFIQFFAFFGFTFVALQYLQGVRGDSPLRAALSVLPLAVAMMLTARLTPRLTARLGARAVGVTGLVLVAAGLAVISRVGTASTYWLLVAGLVPLGIGMGAAMTPATAAITDGIHTGLLCAAGAALLAAIIVAALLSRGSRPRARRDWDPVLVSPAPRYSTGRRGSAIAGNWAAGPAPLNAPPGPSPESPAQRPSPAFTRPFS